MKASIAAVAILLATSSLAQANTASPIAKVLEMLSDLQSKIISQGAEAQKVYEEFGEFCEDRSKQLGFDIKTGKSEAAELKATIDKESSKSEALSAKIERLGDGIAQDEADLKAATAVRTKEATDFAAEEKELSEVISMLERAINILQVEMAKGGASMLQLKQSTSVLDALNILVQSSAISTSDGAKLTALLQNGVGQTQEDASLGAPAASVYEGHSGEIISTLQSLLEKAESQLESARKKETAALHAYDMLKQALSDDIKYTGKDLTEAKKGLSEAGEVKATAQGGLTVCTKNLEVDAQSLADLHKDCLGKARDFEAETKDRDEELKAIAEAKRVISEKTGGADKLVYGLSQSSFLQLGNAEVSSRLTAVRIIRSLARRHQSAALAQLASSVARADTANGDDPFAKVSGLISDMIAKLEDEAAADASHKEYCDKELSEAMARKSEKEGEIEKLTTKVEQMTGRSTALKGEVAALQKSLSELIAAQADMDKVRKEEHADFLANKADLESGLEGVKLAIKILREYYGESSSSHEGAGESIIGLLEVCESDLSKSLAEMTAVEESAAATYTAETKENEIEKASKEQDVAYKSKEAARLDTAVAELTSDKAAVQQELDAVMQSLKVLNKACTTEAETYAERKSRRDAEIAGLKEALAALDGEVALLQSGSQQSLRVAHPHQQ